MGPVGGGVQKLGLADVLPVYSPMINLAVSRDCCVLNCGRHADRANCFAIECVRSSAPELYIRALWLQVNLWARYNSRDTNCLQGVKILRATSKLHSKANHPSQYFSEIGCKLSRCSRARAPSMLSKSGRQLPGIGVSEKFVTKTTSQHWRGARTQATIWKHPYGS